jgi:hypothetical protein
MFSPIYFINKIYIYIFDDIRNAVLSKMPKNINNYVIFDITVAYLPHIVFKEIYSFFSQI